jgi:hypothetical protein
MGCAPHLPPGPPGIAGTKPASNSDRIAFHVMSQVALVATTLVVLFLPGCALALCLGLRRATAVAAAPALTFGLVTAAGTVASVVELPWQPWTFAIGTALACAVAVLVRVAVRRRRGLPAEPRSPLLSRASTADLTIGLGVLVGWAVSAGTLLRGFGGLGNPNQDWDYVFHANALRLIADGGDVDPDALRAINDWEVQSSFYPNAFHALGAVVRDLTGSTVFEVLNAQTLMIAGIAGLGLAALLRSLGAPTAVSAITPVLLAGFASFPYDVVFRGPLLPFATGIALIPAFFVLLLDALRTRRFAPALATGLAAAALLGVQSSTALSAALMVLPFLLLRWLSPDRTVLRELLPLAVVGVSAVVLALPYVGGVLSMNSTGPRVDWPAVGSVGQATGDLLLLNHAAPSPQYWLAGLLLVGLYTLRRAPYMLWWAIAGGIAFALFVISAASDSARVEDLTSPWWNDRWRFAAVVVLAFAPLAAHGLYSIARTVEPLVRRVLPVLRHQQHVASAAIVTAGLLLVILLTEGLYTNFNADRTAGAYQHQRFLSDREVAAMDWLAKESDGEGLVMNDSNDGSAYMSALDGLHPVFGHIVSPGGAPGETQRLLLDHFNCLDSDPAVRAAVQDLDIRYVFLGSGYVRDHFTRVPGLRNMGGPESVELIYGEPGVRIYRVELTRETTDQAEACTIGESDDGNA